MYNNWIFKVVLKYFFVISYINKNKTRAKTQNNLKIYYNKIKIKLAEIKDYLNVISNISKFNTKNIKSNKL